MLVHRHSALIQAALDKCCLAPPLADVTAADGVQHTLWELDFSGIAGAVEAMPMFYVADGHHRCEAAVRAAAEIDALHSVTQGDHHWFPAVIFDEAVVKIHPYHRLLRNIDLRVVTEIDDILSKRGTVTRRPLAEIPPRGSFAVYANRSWRLFTPSASNEGKLDVDLLVHEMLLPVFGIADQRNDTRLDFIGGTKGLRALELAVDSGDASMAIAMHPTELSDVLNVSDADGTMPPKSTWFAPKLISGLFLHAFMPINGRNCDND
jgi:uncharacterized protein (DUF1015 family)